MPTPEELQKIKEAAKDFVEELFRDWEWECSACGSINCTSSKTCRTCNCQMYLCTKKARGKPQAVKKDLN